MKGVENGVEFGVLGRNRLPKVRLLPCLLLDDLIGNKGEDLFDGRSEYFLGINGEFSSNGCSEPGLESALIKFSSIELMFASHLGAGLEGRLFGAGGGDG